jgi:hypothetical protein
VSDDERETPGSTVAEHPDYGLAVCGAGPAGIGLFVAAARDGMLDALLDRGVVLIERDVPGSGTIGRHRISANSLGGAFLEGVDGIMRGPLAWLAFCPQAERLRAHATRHPPLSLVAPFLDEVGRAVTDLLRRHPRCTVACGATVHEVRYDPSGGVTVRAHAGRNSPELTVTAARIVIAMGGEADRDPAELDPVLCAALPAVGGRIAHADDFIDRTRTAPAAVLEAIRRTGRVTVVGASHSAWSVALLLDRGAIDGLPRPRPGGICLLARSGARLYYPSGAEAAADGYPFTSADICPLSGRVNRYGGLRGEARDLARATLGLVRAPSPVRIVSLAGTDPGAIRGELQRAGAVVMATGHRARLPRLRTMDGTDIVPAQDRGGTVVTDLGHLVSSDGTVYPELIVYGLGAGLRPSAAIGGEPSFHRRATGIWLFQNHLGSAVVRDLLSDLVQSDAGEVPR